MGKGREKRQGKNRWVTCWNIVSIYLLSKMDLTETKLRDVLREGERGGKREDRGRERRREG